MAESQGAAEPAPKQNAEQEISYIGARLREKSTYAGLAVALSLALPLLSKYIPGLADANAQSIVADISAIGIGTGGLIAIVLPEKSSLKALAFFLVASSALAFAHPAHAAVKHHIAHHVVATVPLPKADPRGPLYDSTKPPSKGKLTPSQVAQNPLTLIAQFPVADIQNAILLAQAQTPPDTTALTCWNALMPIAQSLATISAAKGGTAPASGSTTPATGNPLQLGAATGIQDTRDAQALLANLQSPTGPLAAVNNACAPVVVQLNTTLTLLGIGGGVVLAGGPVAGTTALTALQALLAALPKL